MIKELLFGLIVSAIIYFFSMYLLPDNAKKIGYIVASIVAFVFLINFLTALLGFGHLLPTSLN